MSLPSYIRQAQQDHIADTLRAKAEIIGKDKQALLIRLREARAVLRKEFKVYFRKSRYSFDKARLVGAGGYYLQWENDGQTSVGSVYLYRS